MKQIERRIDDLENRATPEPGMYTLAARLTAARRGAALPRDTREASTAGPADLGERLRRARDRVRARR